MDFKKISDMLTLGVPVLVVCSCIRLFTYYYHWNIPILDYLSVSELLMLFIQPILVIAALGGIYIVFNLAFLAVVTLFVKTGIIGGKKESTQENAGQNKTETDPRPSQTTKKKRIAGVIVGFFLAFFVGIFFNGIWYDFEIFPTVLVHVVIGFVVIGAGLKLFPDRAAAESYVVGTIVVLLSASFFYGRYQAHNTEKNPTQISITLKDNAVIKTDSDLIYLGKTSSYYFFHSGKGDQRQTSIIPAGEVKATYIRDK